MALSDLQSVWVETQICSNALDVLPDHVQVRMLDHQDPDPIAQAAPAQAVLASSGITYDHTVFARMPHLRILVRTGIGVDNVNVPDATAHGVLFCNTPAGPTESTAEHTIALMMAAAKRIPDGQVQLARGEFAPRGVPLGNELRGKILGLVGFGRIGQRVAEIAMLGLRMRVITHDPFLSAEAVRASGLDVHPVALDTIWREADFISLHAPSIPATRHIVNRDTIARMKDGAYIFNLARGPLLDGEALLEALDAGKLAGAGLDVFDPEPPAVHSRLRTHPRIVATPHSATTTAEARQRIEEMAVEEILRFFQGQPPNNPLNPEVIRQP